MKDLSSLEERVRKIEERNRIVEKDKAWEISITRRILLILFTYIAIGLYLMLVLGVEKWWMHAIIPSLGFLLSTLSLPYFKKVWMKFGK